MKNKNIWPPKAARFFKLFLYVIIQNENDEIQIRNIALFRTTCRGTFQWEKDRIERSLLQAEF